MIGASLTADTMVALKSSGLVKDHLKISYIGGSGVSLVEESVPSDNKPSRITVMVAFIFQVLFEHTASSTISL